MSGDRGHDPDHRSHEPRASGSLAYRLTPRMAACKATAIEKVSRVAGRRHPSPFASAECEERDLVDGVKKSVPAGAAKLVGSGAAVVREARAERSETIEPPGILVSKVPDGRILVWRIASSIGYRLEVKPEGGPPCQGMPLAGDGDPESLGSGNPPRMRGAALCH